MKNTLFALLTLCMIIASCQPDETEADPAADVLIRIENASAYDYQDVIVTPRLDVISYGDVPSGFITPYQKYQEAFRYEYVELQIEGETFIIQPIDWVGETLLTPGNYTYIIEANQSTGTYDRLQLTLRED